MTWSEPIYLTPIDRRRAPTWSRSAEGVKKRGWAKFRMMAFPGGDPAPCMTIGVATDDWSIEASLVSRLRAARLDATSRLPDGRLRVSRHRNPAGSAKLVGRGDDPRRGGVTASGRFLVDRAASPALPTFAATSSFAHCGTVCLQPQSAATSRYTASIVVRTRRPSGLL